MYLPYLYGRRSELLAIRAFAKEFSGSKAVIPVVEPVVARPNDLLTCIDAVAAAGMQMLVVVNPQGGEFKSQSLAAWKKIVLDSIHANPAVLPTFRVASNTSASQASEFLALNKGKQVAVVYGASNWDLTDQKKLAANEQVAFHVCISGRVSHAHRTLIPKMRAVDLQDRFNKMPRNADYIGRELFSDHHKMFSSSSIGFGDYSVIGDEFVPGGGRPGAVVIHGVYRNAATGDLWVEHFVSDDTDLDVGDAASKYVQAVKKFAVAAEKRATEFGVDSALKAYKHDAAHSNFPGLAKNKERQILHHMAVVNKLLG